MIFGSKPITQQLIFALFRKMHLFLVQNISTRMALMKYPYYVEIEITNDCNFACTHCARSLMNRTIGYMEFELFKKIVDEISVYPKYILRIGGMGESALHPELKRFMDYLSFKNIKVDFTTNGTIFKTSSYEEILNWPIDDLGISVDGINNESYNKIRRGGNYLKLKEFVTEFYSVKQRLQCKTPKIKIRNVIFPFYKIDDIENFKKSWSSVADKITFNTLNQIDSFIEYKKFNCCNDIFNTARIRWDGMVPLCGYRYHHDKDEWIGDIKEQTLKQIWNCDRLNAVRKFYIRKKYENLEFCKFCGATHSGKTVKKNMKLHNTSKNPIIQVLSRIVPIS